MIDREHGSSRRFSAYLESNWKRLCDPSHKLEPHEEQVMREMLRWCASTMAMTAFRLAPTHQAGAKIMDEMLDHMIEVYDKLWDKHAKDKLR
jgi:hypothetical protein